MKSLFVLTIAVFLMAVLPHAFAEEQRQGQEKVLTADQQCVVKYLACRDNCDYYDNQKSVQPCKKSCDQSYTCRPKKSAHQYHGNPLME